MKSFPFFFPRGPLTTCFLWIAFSTWLCLLFYASNQTINLGENVWIPHQDKALHFLFFSAGAIAFGAALRETANIRWGLLIAITLLSLSALGFADEINQLHVPGRSGGDPFDWLADFLGATCGLIFLRTLYGQRSERDSKNSRSPKADRTA